MPRRTKRGLTATSDELRVAYFVRADARDEIGALLRGVAGARASGRPLYQSVYEHGTEDVQYAAIRWMARLSPDRADELSAATCDTALSLVILEILQGILASLWMAKHARLGQVSAMAGRMRPGRPAATSEPTLPKVVAALNSGPKGRKLTHGLSVDDAIAYLEADKGGGGDLQALRKFVRLNGAVRVDTEVNRVAKSIARSIRSRRQRR